MDRPDNLLYKFIKINSSWLSGDDKFFVNKIDRYANDWDLKILPRKFDNYFVFAHTNSYCFYKIINQLYIKRNKLKKEIIKGDIVFVCPHEGWSDSFIFSAIHCIIDIFQFEGSLYFYDHTTNNAEMYQRFCKHNDVQPKLECLSLPNPFHNYNLEFGNIRQYVNYDENYSVPLDQQKLYCCFNYTLKSHRAGIVTLLHYYNILDDNLVSSPSRDNHLNKLLFDKDKDFNNFVDISKIQLGKLSFYSNIIEKQKDLKRIWPLRVDDRFAIKTIDHAPISKDLFYARKNSLFEIITETLYDGQLFLTEKTFCSIHLGKPFIMVASAYTLKAINSLGYKTFHPYIDETYDTIEDGNERMLAVVKEIMRLKMLRHFQPQLFYERYEKIIEIAEFNKEKFKNS